MEINMDSTSNQRQKKLAGIASLIQPQPYSKLIEWPLILKFVLRVTSP